MRHARERGFAGRSQGGADRAVEEARKRTFTCSLLSTLGVVVFFSRPFVPDTPEIGPEFIDVHRPEWMADLFVLQRSSAVGRERPGQPRPRVVCLHLHLKQGALLPMQPAPPRVTRPLCHLLIFGMRALFLPQPTDRLCRTANMEF